jgi:uncharacterized membrane protein YhaH (DUF805 family)
MRGEILYFESGADVGLIRSADGAHYRFRSADLGEGQAPTAGAFAEFTPRDAEWASQIVVKGVDGPPPEKLDIWGYFAKSMRMSFNGVGRARRLEYWSFILFSFLMLVGIFLVLMGIGAAGQMRAGPAFTDSFAMLATPVLILAFVGFLPASLTVLIRLACVAAIRAAGRTHLVHLHAVAVGAGRQQARTLSESGLSGVA